MGHWITIASSGTVTTPTAPNDAPNVTATAAPFYADGQGTEVSDGDFYGFKGVITIPPTTDPDYARLRIIHVIAVDPAGYEHEVYTAYAPFSTSTVNWKSDQWDRAPAVFSKVEFRCENDASHITASPYAVTSGITVTGMPGAAQPTGVSATVVISWDVFGSPLYHFEAAWTCAHPVQVEVWWSLTPTVGTKLNGDGGDTSPFRTDPPFSFGTPDSCTLKFFAIDRSGRRNNTSPATYALTVALPGGTSGHEFADFVTGVTFVPVYSLDVDGSELWQATWTATPPSDDRFNGYAVVLRSTLLGLPDTWIEPAPGQLSGDRWPIGTPDVYDVYFVSRDASISYNSIVPGTTPRVSGVHVGPQTDGSILATRIKPSSLKYGLGVSTDGLGASTVGDNMVPNGNFESPEGAAHGSTTLTNWTLTSSTTGAVYVEKSTVSSGSQCVSFSPATTSTLDESAGIPVISLETYVLTLRALARGADAPIYVIVGYRDKDGSYVGGNPAFPLSQSSFTSWTSTAPFTFTPPTGVAYVVLTFGCAAAFGNQLHSGLWSVDAVSLKRQSIAADISLGDGLTAVGNTVAANVGGALEIVSSVIGVKALGITTALIDTFAVSAAQIAAGAVDATKIAALAVGTAQIANAAITTAKITNLAITNALIADAAITTAKIGTAQIISAQIVSLDAVKINVGTLNSVNMSGGTLALNLNGVTTLINNGTSSTGFAGFSCRTNGSFTEARITPGQLTLFRINAINPLVNVATVQISSDSYGLISMTSTDGTHHVDLFAESQPALSLDGHQVVTTRRAAVTRPSGGSVIDTQARQALNDLLDRLSAATFGHGLIP